MVKSKSQENNLALNVIIKGAGIVFLGLFISKFFGYLYRILLANYLGKSDYGSITLAWSIVGFLSMLCLLGLPIIITRLVSIYNAKKDKKKIDSVISSSLVLTSSLSLIATTLLLFFSEFISTKIFHTETLTPILRIIALSLPLSVIISILEATTVGFKQVKYVVYTRNIFENLVKVSLTALFFYWGFTILGMSWAYVITMLLTLLLLLYFQNKKVYPIKITENNEYSQLLQSSLPLLFSGFLVFALGWIDTILLGYFKNVSDVGVYNIALPSAFLLYVIPSAIMVIFLPVISELYSKKAEIREVYSRINKWIILVNLPIMLILILFSRQFINILFGPEYLSGALALSILAVGVFLNSLSQTSINILYSYDKAKLVFYNNLILFFCMVLLDLILIPPYGITGAAIGTTLSLVIITLLTQFQAYRVTRVFPFNIKSVIKLLLVSVISVIFIEKFIRFLFPNRDLLVLIFASLLLSIIYLMLIFITKTLDNHDKAIIQKVFLFIKRKSHLVKE